MNRIFPNPKSSARFCAVCITMYTLVYLGRCNLSTVAPYIIQAGAFDKSMLGIINGVFFLTYGLGQIVCGVMGDKISPFKLIGVGVAVSAATNALMAVTTNPTAMCIFWMLNGAGQASVFPCVIRIISTMLVQSQRRNANMLLTFTFTFGAIINTVLAVIMNRFFSWQGMFVCSAILLTVMLLVWIYETFRANKIMVEAELPDLPDEAPEQKPKYSFWTLMFTSGLLLAIVPVLIRTLLTGSLSSWTSTMMMETFNITPEFSTVISNVIPIINLTGGYLATTLTGRAFKNEVSSSVFFFAVMTPLLALLLCMQSLGLWVSLALVALSSALGYAVLQTLSIMLPARYAEYGCVATIAGIVNAISSAGAFMANGLLGTLSENFGWNAVIWCWTGSAGLALVLCLVAAIQRKRFDAKTGYKN